MRGASGPVLDRGPRVTVWADGESFAAGAAERVARALIDAAGEDGVARLALAGGSTPRPVYRRLAGAPWLREVPWRRVEVFWSDERCVPPDHPESNYRMAREELLDRVPVAAERVHRVRGELEPAAAAAAYGQDVESTVGRPPVFDLVLLGMGADGHTASLFPAQLAEAAGDPHPGEVVAATMAPAEPRRRVTFTLSCLNAARRVWFLVRGAEKAAMVSRVLRALRSGGPAQGPPAARVRPTDGELVWMLDGAAAAELPEERR